MADNDNENVVTLKPGTTHFEMRTVEVAGANGKKAPVSQVYAVDPEGQATPINPTLPIKFRSEGPAGERVVDLDISTQGKTADGRPTVNLTPMAFRGADGKVAYPRLDTSEVTDSPVAIKGSFNLEKGNARVYDVTPQEITGLKVNDSGVPAAVGGAGHPQGLKGGQIQPSNGLNGNPNVHDGLGPAQRVVRPGKVQPAAPTAKVDVALPAQSGLVQGMDKGHIVEAVIYKDPAKDTKDPTATRTVIVGQEARVDFFESKSGRGGKAQEHAILTIDGSETVPDVQNRFKAATVDAIHEEREKMAGKYGKTPVEIHTPQIANNIDRTIEGPNGPVKGPDGKLPSIPSTYVAPPGSVFVDSSLPATKPLPPVLREAAVANPGQTVTITPSSPKPKSVTTPTTPTEPARTKQELPHQQPSGEFLKWNARGKQYESIDTSKLADDPVRKAAGEALNKIFSRGAMLSITHRHAGLINTVTQAANDLADKSKTGNLKDDLQAIKSEAQIIASGKEQRASTSSADADIIMKAVDEALASMGGKGAGLNTHRNDDLAKYVDPKEHPNLTASAAHRKDTGAMSSPITQSSGAQKSVEGPVV